MLKSQHHMIFYPEDRTKLDECTKPRPASVKPCSLPCAVLVPHASYSMVSEALHRSFEQVQMLKPSLVVFLGPLHQEVLSEDEPAFLFTPESEGITIAGFDHLFATSLADKLCTMFPTQVVKQDSYFIEEPALELTLPFIQSYFGNTPTLPLLCGSCNKAQLAVYTKVLQAITKLAPQVLFIVSSNANAVLPATEAAKHAAAFVRTLSKGSSLCEGLRTHTISSCNAASLDAVAAQSWANGHWDITAMFLGGKEYETIEAELDDPEKHVWHISATLGASHDYQ